MSDNKKWLWPSADTKSYSRGYVEYQGTVHVGVDITAAYGTPVLAAKDGIAETVYTGCKNKNGANSTNGVPCSTSIGCTGYLSEDYDYCNYMYGNGVKIKHGDSDYSHYGHFDRVAEGIVAGKAIKRGEVIGYVGFSGEVTVHN